MLEVPLRYLFAPHSLSVYVVGGKVALTCGGTLPHYEDKRAMTIMENLQRLEDLLHVVRKRLQIRDYLERAFGLVILEDDDAVTPYKTGDELASAFSVELGD